MAARASASEPGTGGALECRALDSVTIGAIFRSPPIRDSPLTQSSWSKTLSELALKFLSVHNENEKQAVKIGCRNGGSCSHRSGRFNCNGAIVHDPVGDHRNVPDNTDG